MTFTKNYLTTLFRILILFLVGFIIFFTYSHVEAEDLISLFPLDHYDQTVSNWIKSTDPDYDKPLLSLEMQKQHLDNFYKAYYSPWNADYITTILQSPYPNDLKTAEQSIIDDFSNENKSQDNIGYAENFRPYAVTWIKHIENNINISQLDRLSYEPHHRAIAVDNLQARVLPTTDVHFYNYQIAGQGYPFDNLQMSSIWAGTPLYIIAETQDHAWSMVITPDFIAWVKTNGIATVDNAFITQWQSYANHHLASITKTETTLVDEQNQFLLKTYIGSIFPAIKKGEELQLLVPVNDSHHHAIIQYSIIATGSAALIPLTPTPHHFSDLMTSLINRPYGWGNLYFYNDCSGELKNIYTSFGIWLPRHSSDQILPGKVVDMTSASPEKRLAYLMENGRKFFTIVYIGGHNFMFMGNVANPNDVNQNQMALTYQNIWGLSPNPPSRRAVIGQAVIFPLLLQYPEDTSLISLANKKYFQVSYLDEAPNFIKKPEALDLRSMMH